MHSHRNGFIYKIRYLGVYIVQSRTFKCSLSSKRKAFYRSANAIFGKIGHIASEEVVLQLIKSKCIQIQRPNTYSTGPSTVSVLGNQVELVESFTYLGCRINADGGSEEEICRRIEITRGCMKSLNKYIWRLSLIHI